MQKKINEMVDKKSTECKICEKSRTYSSYVDLKEHLEKRHKFFL
jgi:hypothetical protein